MAKARNWVRWLMVLPTVFVVAVVVSLLFAAVQPRSLALLAQSLVLPLVYIGVAAWVAPSSKFRVAVVLAVLTIYNLASGYWPTRHLVQLSPSDLLVQAIALNAVGVVAGLFLVRRLARSRDQSPA